MDRRGEAPFQQPPPYSINNSDPVIAGGGKPFGAHPLGLVTIESQHHEVITTKKKKTPGPGVLAYVLGYFVRILELGLIFYLFYLGFQSYSIFTWHIVTLSVGYIALYNESVMIFSPILNIFPKLHKRKDKITAHWMLNATAFLLSVVGVGTIEKYLLDFGYDHFHTWHSWLGILAIFGFLLQFAFGMMVKYPNLTKGWMRFVTVKLVHSVAALLEFILMFACFLTSFYSGWTTWMTSFGERTAITTVLTVIAVSVGYVSADKTVLRIKNYLRASRK